MKSSNLRKAGTTLRHIGSALSTVALVIEGYLGRELYTSSRDQIISNFGSYGYEFLKYAIYAPFVLAPFVVYYTWPLRSGKKDAYRNETIKEAEIIENINISKTGPNGSIHQATADSNQEHKELQTLKSSEEIIVQTAKAIGIATEGKTLNQISDEIVSRGKKQA